MTRAELPGVKAELVGTLKGSFFFFFFNKINCPTELKSWEEAQS